MRRCLALGSKRSFRLNYHKNDAIRNFSKEIMDIDEIIECHHVTGAADFLLKVLVKDIASYERLILDRLSKIQEIGHLQTMMILSTAKSSKSLPLNY
jgi:Lrp/AsnC family leucine-responsive transcriptional regulator